ncbi:kynureninase [Flaviaesturariibacter flavus]|uniref:Kynureninase n=1 Tax=Flaviaesturariibacter flavus TaxID=2502780 RepID=A0A4R1BJU4_9BACT|nr:kynureninase [Flaviaesturariibacter flavus]TCJ17478.1 kynureninase [Flaviaesturariibacter flavus]
MQYENTLEFARQQDAADPLKSFREKFFIPQHNGKDTVYLTGNSLGLQPQSTREYIQQELDDWAQLGVEGHFQAKNPWLHYHELFPSLLAPIVGALPHEVVAMNQLTVNLHLLMATFYRPTKDRFKILCEAKAFPSDQYALESQARLHGFDPKEAVVEVAPRPGEYCLREEDIIDAINQHGPQLALVLFGGVNYYTGQVLPMQAITDVAHNVGALAGFDLAHAAGNIRLQLHDWDVDFACWCSYKYLNSGPGSVAGAYIHERHCTNTELPRAAGWWGYEKDTRFQMKPLFKAIPTAEGWQLSNAPVLSMAAHRASLDIYAAAGMDALTQKSKTLTGYLFHVLDEINAAQEVKVIEVITPRGAGEHGCQVSLLMLQKGREVFKALTERGVIADWREPNVIRVAPVPLYNSFEDVWRFGEIIREVL